MLALTAQGDVYAWGDGEQGQLGRKVLERTKIHGVKPERVVVGIRTNKIKVIGAGMYTSYAVDVDGDVWAWGLNNMGQTGTNKDYDTEELVVQTPQMIPALSPDELGGDRVIQITGGEHHTIFLTEKGRVFACGRGEGGQLGLADSHPAVVERRKLNENKPLDYIITPSEIKFPIDHKVDPIIRIGAGIRNNIAVSKDGGLYAWGEGNQGELGLGDDEANARTPTIVVRREGGAWRAIDAACGGQHTIGILRKRE
jgi:regulator of chromosome condensation